MSNQAATPMPTLAATRAAIADRIVLDAIDAYEDADRRYREIEEAIADDHDLDKFNGLSHERLKAARAHLVRSILARHVDADWAEGRGLELTVHPTCGVSRGGRLYQAAVIPEYANSRPGDEPMHLNEPVMQLVVVDVADVDGLGSAVRDLAAAAAVAPGAPGGLSPCPEDGP